jgi:hypothetical protein
VTEAFLEEWRFEAYDEANAQDTGDIRQSALLKTILAWLEDAGVVSDPQLAFFQSRIGNRTAEVHAYSMDTDDDVLNLFYLVDANTNEPFGSSWRTQAVTKETIDRGLSRLSTFVDMVGAGRLTDIEDSQPAAELIDLIVEAQATARKIAISVITTGQATDRGMAAGSSVNFDREIWDLVRLARVCGGGRNEPLSVDFSKEFSCTLPCLMTPRGPDGLRVLLTQISGPVLGQLYNQHRARLLERNVRSFLQFTAKVNQGIRDTALRAPSRFLSYNNGIAATASSVTIDDIGEGVGRIRRVDDFQIVNGGQTTATIAAVLRRDQADLSAVSIAMKLTVVPAGHLDELVPLIARFANTQNRIQEADFSANHPWHVVFERHSRDTWAPALDPSIPRGTRWYYERSRGQYSDDLAAANTTAAKRRFREENPPKQKMGKTDLAKFVLSWDQRPTIVCRGAQKAFAAFMSQISAAGKAPPEKSDFMRIVSQAILFRTAERLYSDLELGNYRAQAVTYAISRLSHETERRLPWDEIWNTQTLPQEIVSALKIIMIGIHDAIAVPPGGRNVTEWCKSDQCAVAVMNVPLEFELASAGQWQPYATFTAYQVQQPATGALLEAILAIPPDVWYTIAKWAKENNELMPWQRGLAFSLGRLREAGKPPSVKQGIQGRKLLLDAVAEGYSHPDLDKSRISAISAAPMDQ